MTKYPKFVLFNYNYFFLILFFMEFLENSNWEQDIIQKIWDLASKTKAPK